MNGEEPLRNFHGASEHRGIQRRQKFGAVVLVSWRDSKRPQSARRMRSFSAPLPETRARGFRFFLFFLRKGLL